MRSRNGSPPSLEVALRFVKPTNKQRLFITQIKHHRYRAMAGSFHHDVPHAGVLVKIEFSVGQFLSVKEVFQRSAVAAKIPRVNEKVGACTGRVFQNHGFGHGWKDPTVGYNSSLFDGDAQYRLSEQGPLTGLAMASHGQDGVHGLRGLRGRGGISASDACCNDAALL